MVHTRDEHIYMAKVCEQTERFDDMLFYIKKVLEFNENGEIIYTASSDRTIISWSIPKGEKLKTYAHSAAINTFCLTNKHLISGDNTGTIYFWDKMG